ncbi:MAG: hypothetical protein ABW185_01715, partial [Sedimenticola sp.]
QYIDSLLPDDHPETFEDWCPRRNLEIPQFQFWYTAFQLELLVLTFVRSLRTSNFALYIDCLTMLVPWFFSLDHTNYARWGAVHIRDMMCLCANNSEIADEFKNGNFTVQKSRRVFSSIAIDHAHEQNNAAVKAEGGAVGIIQSHEALKRWMVAGPELVRIAAEFESTVHGVHTNVADDTDHHEQTGSAQVTFTQHVQRLVSVVE